MAKKLNAVKYEPSAVDGKYNNAGEEIMDPTPLALPIGFKRPPTLTETIQRLVRGPLMALHAKEKDMETFEEADDFDVPDDTPDPNTPFETEFEGVENPYHYPGNDPFQREEMHLRKIKLAEAKAEEIRKAAEKKAATKEPPTKAPDGAAVVKA